MMIIVPTLAHGENCQHPVVARFIARHILFASVNMRERIDAKRCVIEHNRAPQESDHQARPSCDEKTEYGECNRRQDFEFVQPQQFGELGKIGDFHQVGLVVLPIENPTKMAIEKTLMPGRMHVLRGVGV